MEALLSKFFTVTERPERRQLLGHASAAVRWPGQSGLPGIISMQFPPLEGVLASTCTQNWTGRKVLESRLLFPLSGCLRAVQLLAYSCGGGTSGAGGISPVLYGTRLRLTLG